MKTKSRPIRPALKPSARCFFVLSFGALSAVAQSSVILGASDGFAVLGGSAVTDAGGSVFFGNVGVSPGTSITGIVGASVSGGSIHLNDTLAIQAHTDAESAYNYLAGLDSDFSLISAELGGLILAPGVYTLADSALLTGNLTLNGEGFVNPEWVFQIDSTLTTASGSSILAINGANSSNIYFQVGSSATLGSGTDFVGNILADQSISSTSGTTVNGRLLAINAAVTMGGTVVTIPETSASALAALSLCGVLFSRRRNR